MERKRVDGRYVAEGPEPKKRKSPAAVPQPRHCRTYTRRRVAAALPEIVETFLEKAKQGSVPHAKALASLGGLDKGDVVPKVVRRKKSFAEELLRTFGEPDVEDKGAGEREPGK